MKKYFITGATGAIGCAMIPQLLSIQDAELVLLVRAENKDHLNERLEKIFKYCKFSEEDERRSRVHGIIGDVSLPDFGIEREAFKEISLTTTHIIHAAGNVRMNLTIEDARSCSLNSAKNVITLAEKAKEIGNLKKVEFVSTVGVGGRMPGIVREDWITVKREYHNTYEQAKAEAEDYIKKYVGKGFPITVHRPSMVVGDSKTGEIIHYQIFYHLCEFLSGRRTLGVTPSTGNTKLDIIPSDYVAKVIVWSSLTDKSVGKIMHECSGGKHALVISNLRKRVLEIYIQNGIDIPNAKVIPLWLFKSILPVIGVFVSKKARRSMKALPVFFNYLAENISFDNTKTRLLVKDEIEFPSIDSYLHTILGYYLKNK